jgi:hypothetical protein
VLTTTKLDPVLGQFRVFQGVIREVARSKCLELNREVLRSVGAAVWVERVVTLQASWSVVFFAFNAFIHFGIVVVVCELV